MKSAPNLILVGPMGSGKSSLGRRLAADLGLQFVDSDQEIERSSGASIALIFELEGEAGFRTREHRMLARLCQRQGQLIATGGGAVLHPETRRLLPQHGFVVYLDVDLETQLQRLSCDRSRPLLQQGDRREKLRQLATERTPLYAEVADLRFKTGQGSAQQAANRLLALLRDHWRGPEAPHAKPCPPETTPETTPMRQVHVELSSRRYPIRIGPGLLQQDAWPDLIPGRHVLIVSDQNVAPHYLARVQARLDNRLLREFILPPGESEKTLTRFSQALSELATMRASRDACVLALGGGVIGDLAGFAAACWMRGIAFVQLPTTLLAMVDSSVGGKTAVDLPEGKNLVGAFHQPLAVIADTDTLATLPERELRAGLAEVVKYGALGDPEFFTWLERNSVALLARDSSAITEAVERSCRHKAAIVARDETEQGDRALLNFGHSFGHALEAADAYGGLLHGEAVAIGLLLATRLSNQLGLADEADHHRLETLLHAFGLPTRPPPGSDPARLLELMRLDKKNLSGRLRLILWRGLGRALIVPDVDENAVLNCLQSAVHD